ncbi:MAG TPA: PfkB family carbohydrate kinase [Myxococcota bacterium]|nr:PfkB family carbohydrate kinase [Myxococcota bacterium]
MSPADLAVVGIGSMAVDRIRRVPRILGGDEKASVLPAADGSPLETKVGGVVLNHLGWAAALGLRVGIFGRQADDAPGRFLRAAMTRLGIATEIDLDGSASTTAEIFVDPQGARAIYMAPGATSETTAEHVRAHAAFIARGRRLTTEVSQLPLPAVLEALALAREAGASTVLDLDLPPSDATATLGSEAELDRALRAAEILKPSKSAAAELFPDADGDALAIARATRDRYGNAAVVVTDGAAGCAVASEGFEGRVPAPRVEPLDTTGAGDAFLGGLLVGLDAGLGWEDAARLANACGAACCEKLGAFPDDPAAARARALALYDGAPVTLGPAPSARPAPGDGAHEALGTMSVMVDELSRLLDEVDATAFDAAVALVLGAEEKQRRVHVTGVGKPEHVARYAASLLSSTGTAATFLHGTEAIHGSAGQVAPGDVVIAISNSGDTAELRGAVEAVQALGAQIVAVAGRPDSWLARASQVSLHAGVSREGGGLGLAPRASVAAQVLVVAALSGALERARGFTAADYLARHPAGALGRSARGETKD